MILHCSQKLAAKLDSVSPVQLKETSPLGSWHGHLYSLDRRQMDLNPVAVSRYLNERPATVYGKLVWPERAMLEVVARL